jgi:hypothetical protein
MTFRALLLALAGGVWLPCCIQTSAQCTQPAERATTEQTGERQTADGLEVEARGRIEEER